MPAKRTKPTKTTRKPVRHRSPSRDSPGTAELLARLAQRCREARLAADLSQEEAGERAKLSPKHVGAVEYGKANPTITTLAALAKAYGVTLSKLLDGV